MSGRSEPEEKKFRDELVESVFEFTGGNPRDAMHMLISMGLAVMLAGYCGNRAACANHFELLSEGICKEMRGEVDDRDFRTKH